MSRVIDWEQEAARELKASLKRRGLTYQDLTDLLNGAGEEVTTAAVSRRVTRGGFSYAFFLKCMHLIARGDSVAMS